MKAVRTVIASHGVPYFQMTSVRSHSTSEREEEGHNERTGYTMEQKSFFATNMASQPLLEEREKQSSSFYRNGVISI